MKNSRKESSDSSSSQQTKPKTVIIPLILSQPSQSRNSSGKKPNEIYESSLNSIIDIYLILNKKEKDINLQELDTAFNELIAETNSNQHLILPIILGFYIQTYENKKIVSKTIKNYILSIVKRDIRLGHLLMHTIFSCKHSFKKKVEMKVLKEIILELDIQQVIIF